MPVAKPPAPVQPQYLWWAVVCGHKWQQEKKHWWTAKHEGCERERGGGHSNPLCFESSVLCDSKFTSAHHVQWVALAWSQGEQVPGHRYSLSAEVGASEWAQGRSRSWVSVSLSFSFPHSLALSLTPSHKHTLPPSLSPHPIPIVCLIRGSFVAGFHTRTPASVAAFFSQGLPCSSVTPSLFNLHGNASMCLCVCVLRVCPPAVCVSEHMRTTHIHTFTYEWKGTPYHQSQGMPGIMERDVIITKIFIFCCPPSTSFVFDKHSIDPSWPGVLCLLTVKKQAAQTHDYCGYFWKTSMDLIFHLLKNSACWRPPPKTTPSLNSNLCFSHSHTMLFCGMWRPQHTSEVLMLPSVWILKYCPLTHSA